MTVSVTQIECKIDFKINSVKEVGIGIEELQHQFHSCNHFLFITSFINQFLKHSLVSHW